jgi:cyclic dehypoxanthinyl futalosine synthase
MRRIDPQEALALYGGDWHELARRAGEITQALHPGGVRTYLVERNINYTNVCVCRCSFCAFSVAPRDPRAFVLSEEELAEKVVELRALGGTQVLLQGGMHPGLDLAWHERLLRGLKGRFPDLHLHAYSPPEVVFFARQAGLDVAAVLTRLRAAGLESLPGGGAEVLVDRVRRAVAPAKCSSDEWLEVMRQAHRLGLCTTATMMFGHVETLAERIEHLERLRQLQDESLARRQRDPAAGVFTAFTCWPFQPGNTPLGARLARESPRREPGGKPCEAAPEPRSPRRKPGGDLRPGEPPAARPGPPAGAMEYLRMTALARVYLDNFANLQASWVTQGAQVGQLGLLSGCNDLGSLMMEENVVAAAGTSFRLQRDELRQLIVEAGFRPVQRDFYYRPVAGPADSSRAAGEV